MADDVPQLTHKTGLKVAIAIGGVLVLVAIALGLYVVFVRAKTHTPTLAENQLLADDACPKVTASHFYKIEKDGKTSWLLGTRHAGVALEKYPPAVADAFKAAQTAVFESLPDDTTFAASGDFDLATVLGPDDWNHYREIVGEEMAERVRHKGIRTATAAVSLLYEDRAHAIDQELMELAKSTNKQLVALEDAKVTDHLAETYIGSDTLKTGLKQVTRRELLASETHRSLVQYCTTGERNGPGSFDRVTNDRTISWKPKLLPLLEQGGVFIAVGVDHVDAGTLDLGRMIEQDGFTVTRVE